MTISLINTSITSPNGVTMPVIGGVTSDADILLNFIGHFFWWEVMMYGLVVFLLFAKLIIERKMKRDPIYKKKNQWLYDIFDSASGSLFIFLSVLNLGLWIYRLYNW